MYWCWWWGPIATGMLWAAIGDTSLQFVFRVDDLEKVAGASHDMVWQEPLPAEYAALATKEQAFAKGFSMLRENLVGEPIAEAHGFQHTESGIGSVHRALAFALYMMELRQVGVEQNPVVAILEPMPLPVWCGPGKG